MPDKDIQLAANYDTPYDISGSTFLMLSPAEAAGISLKLRPNYSEWRSLSYQWYEGDTAAGTPLNSFDSFEIGKTYTARVKVTATEGIIFTDAATIKIQQPGSNLEVANDRVDRATDNSYLAFDLHLLTKPELTMALAPGDTLPTAADLTAQLPTGYTVQTLTWAGGAATVPSGATEVTITKLEIRPSEGSYQLANSSVWINGTEHTGTYSSGTLTLTNITVPVKPKGVEVSGTVTSYGDETEKTYVQLIPAGGSEAAYEGIVPGNSATYSFPTVPAGTYTLKVMKKGHAPWTESITVGTEAVTRNVKICLLGDVNGDGKIDADDVTALLRHVSKISNLSKYEETLGEVTADGIVNADDVTKLLRYVSKIIATLE